MSPPYRLSTVVPQDSVLGPLSFSRHGSSLSDARSPTCFICFYRGHQTDLSHHQTARIIYILARLASIFSWGVDDHRTLDLGKTEFECIPGKTHAFILLSAFRISQSLGADLGVASHDYFLFTGDVENTVQRLEERRSRCSGYIVLRSLWIFVTIFSQSGRSTNSDPLASSRQSYNSYGTPRAKANTCFLRDVFQTP